MNLLDSFSIPAARRLKTLRPTVYHRLRTVVAITLAVMLLLPTFGLVVSAHAPATADLDYDYFLLYAAENGDTVCREANASERGELEKISPRNLRQLNHLGDKATGLAAEADNDVTHLTLK